MSGNRVAHPVLISLANIDANIRSKTSLHAYLLLALLPVAKFTHQTTRVRSLLQDRLFHQALNIVLSPLKVAAEVGVMMSDPVGNLRYCFTPLASWIADTPEECLIAATGPKASPVTTAMSKNFGDPHRHPPRTAEETLLAIRSACSKYSPKDYKNFLKVIKSLGLNGVVEPVWMDWPLSDPCYFITIEPLHHFHRFAWDHDVKWCISALGAAELDFRFSIIQTPVGYRAFDEGISRLKQVTGRDHRAVQRYIIGIVAGGVPQRFLIAIRALLDFRYLAQASTFTARSVDRVAQSLQEFHDHKDAIIRHGARTNWEIPKLELLQSVVPGIRQSGAPMQWTADVTEHAHVDEIKVPARAGNNQNYYNQIARHLDRLEKCFRFDLAMYTEERRHLDPSVDEGLSGDYGEDHEPDTEKLSISEYVAPTRPIIDYFSASLALLEGSAPTAPRPFRTFATSTTAFHVAIKPSSRLTLAEAAVQYRLPDLIPAVSTFLTQQNGSAAPPDNIKLQIWHSVRVQQMSYHNRDLEPPQTLRATPPSVTNPHGQYDSVIVSTQPESDWPKSGLVGHVVIQLRIIFRPLHCDFFAAYVQRFNAGSVSKVTGMHLLKRAVRANGDRIGEVIPMTFVRSPAHLIPHFGAEAHARLNKLSSHELSTEFWLNKYWSKEFYYALSPIMM